MKTSSARSSFDAQQYTNLSCVWDRKTRPEDHRLATQACRVMAMVIAGGGFFYPILTRIIDSFSCSPLITSFYRIKNMKKASRKSSLR